MFTPPKIYKEARPPSAATDGSMLKLGDKWIDTANNHLYFVYRKPWNNKKNFIAARVPVTS